MRDQLYADPDQDQEGEDDEEDPEALLHAAHLRKAERPLGKSKDALPRHRYRALGHRDHTSGVRYGPGFRFRAGS